MVVVENVDPAEPLASLRDELANLALLRDVGAAVKATVSLDRCRKLLACFAQIARHHAGTFGREPFDGDPTDAARRSRDDRDFPLEPSHRSPIAPQRHAWAVPQPGLLHQRKQSPAEVIDLFAVVEPGQNDPLDTDLAELEHLVHDLLRGSNERIASPTGDEAFGKLFDLCIERSTLDAQHMGGTSFDASIVENGKGLITRSYELEWEVPLIVPMLDIHSIGAGGGSIGWIDEGGSLRVGPRSAGSDPGPACYGRGGTEATITDANLILGRLEPTLGNKFSLDRDAAERAVERLARRIGLTTLQTAEGMIRITSESMDLTVTSSATSPRRATVIEGVSWSKLPVSVSTMASAIILEA